jgi:hypothetical protein
MNEKWHFDVATNNSSIELCFLISRMRLQHFRFT